MTTPRLRRPRSFRGDPKRPIRAWIRSPRFLRAALTRGRRLQPSQARSSLVRNRLALQVIRQRRLAALVVGALVSVETRSTRDAVNLGYLVPQLLKNLELPF
jgi:hypothetical protein